MKKLPYWLKGAIIGLIIGALIAVLWPILDLIPNYDRDSWMFLYAVPMVLLSETFNICRNASCNELWIIFSLFIGMFLVLGLIIGWIIGVLHNLSKPHTTKKLTIIKKIILVLVITILAFVATVISVKHENFKPGVTGNVCEVTTENPRGLCYEDLPVGGYPFPYLFDQGGITGQGRLEIFDEFNTGWFIADWGFYFLVFLLIVLLSRKNGHLS